MLVPQQLPVLWLPVEKGAGDRADRNDTEPVIAGKSIHSAQEEIVPTARAE